MQAAIEQFRANIDRVRNLGAISRALSAQTTGVLDLSDILRAELVMSVSALDHYIHEIVRLGILDAYQGNRTLTQACLRFQVTLDRAIQGISDPTNVQWLEDQIRTHHGYQSFQNPDNIADAIRLVPDVQLWNEVANRLRMDSQILRLTFRLVINRRNQIAHEADLDPSFPNTRWPINELIVDDAVDLIERIAETIYIIVS